MTDIINCFIEHCDKNESKLSEEAFITICNSYQQTEEEVMELLYYYNEKGRFFKIDYEGWIFVSKSHGKTI